MIFLIDYDRRAGKIVTFRKFDDFSIRPALDHRLNLELELHRQGIDREVVLFDAPNEAALQKTHGRYFKSLSESIQEFIDAIREKL